MRVDGLWHCSVLNVVTVFPQNGEALVRRRIHVDGNALHSRQRRYQNVPIGFVFGKIQKIILIIDGKLQFLFSLYCRAALGQDGHECPSPMVCVRPIVTDIREQKTDNCLLLVVYVHVLGVDYAFVFLGSAVGARLGACPRTRGRPGARSL